MGLKTLVFAASLLISNALALHRRVLIHKTHIETKYLTTTVYAKTATAISGSSNSTSTVRPSSTLPVLPTAFSENLTVMTTTTSSSSEPVTELGSEKCEGPDSHCIGDVTHWDGDLGACGWIVNSAADMQIALPWAFMGSQSNDNPYCGRKVSILNATGDVVGATVGDKCGGCTGFSIDLTNALFAAVVPNGDGRVSGIRWWLD